MWMEKRSGSETRSCRGQEEDKNPAKEAEEYLVIEKENQMNVASGSLIRK